MKFLKFNPKKSKAQAMVEFAIVLPILLLVVYGLIEVGRLIFIVASVNNASRQAVRYGSTSGVGPNGVPRYQDCAGIRDAAQNSDFLNVFDDADIEITYDNPDGIISYDPTCDGATDTSVTPSTGDRVNVRIDANFNAILPNFLPFLSRPVISESARTLLLTINIEPPKEPTTVVITSDNPDPSEVGELVLVTVTVSATTTPTGEVYITGADQNCTITLSGGTGSCNVRFLTAGSKTLIASYIGDVDHEASITDPGEPHTVNPATTITTITTDTPDPSLADPNQPINVTVTVTSAYGTPTGSVDITGAGTNCTIPALTGGTGSCNVTFSSVGVYTLTATYNGSADHKPSSDTEIHNVTPPDATFTVITGDSPDPSVVGQTVTVSVAVTGITTPTGTVVITGADTNCTITLSGGTGSCNVVFNSTGNKILVATYNPDTPAHTGSSDTENHAVSLPFTTTTITADNPDPSAVGQSVNVTVTVTGGSTTPTGTVTISGADVNCTITLAGGTGTCAVVFNSAGDKTLTATYSGDGSHAGSNDIESHTVSGTTPTIQCLHSHGPLVISGKTMSMTINNNSISALTVKDVTIFYNSATGRGGNGSQSLELESASLVSQFWSGKITAPSYTISTFTNPPLTIPIGPSTITFTFKFDYAVQSGTERILINLSTPGCESYPIDSDIISNPN